MMRGRPYRAQEYREVTILLDVVCAVDPSPIEEHHALCECEEALRSQLDRYARDGWQPVGALDFPTLWAEHRVQRRDTGAKFVFESVRVPMRRSAAGRHAAVQELSGHAGSRRADWRYRVRRLLFRQ